MKTLLSPMLFYFYKNSLKNSPLAGNTKPVLKALTVQKMFCLAALIFLANLSFAQTKIKSKEDSNSQIYNARLSQNSSSKGIAALLPVPWYDGFESSTVGNLILPANWTSGDLLGIRNNAGVSDGSVDLNKGAPRTGSKYFYTEYGTTLKLVTPSFQLTAGVSYIFSFWGTETRANGSNFGLGIKYGTQSTYDAMSNELRASSTYTPGVYTKSSYTITPTVSGVYYIGLEIDNPSDWSISRNQLNFDDFSLVERCANLPFVLPTFEGFNNNELPCGWADTRISPTGNSYMNFPTVSAGGSVSPQEGDGMVQYQSIAAGSGSSERLETPAFSTIGMCSVTTSFKWHNTTAGSNDTMQPQYNIGEGWVSFGSSFPRKSTSVGWVDKNFDLPPVALNKTNVKIGFLFQSQRGNSMFMDNVVFTPKYSPTITTQPAKNNSVCLNGTVTPLSVVAGGTGPFTYQWYYNTTDSNTVASATPIAGATSSTYSPPSNAVGTRYYFVVVTGSCATGTVNSVNSNTAVFTVTPASVGGTITAAQTICFGTAPASLTLSGQTGDVLRWQKASNAAFTGAVNVNYATTTLTSAEIGILTTNTYFRAVVQNGVCGVVYSNPVLITVGPGTTTTFRDGTGWSNGFPDINKKAVFEADYDTTNGNITACNCEVQSGIKLIIGEDSNVTIQNNIENNGDIIVESDGNLIQINNSGSFTGNNVTVKRKSRMKRLDYIYWGTPVTGQTLRTFSPKTVASRFYSYNEVDDSFSIITPLTDAMIKGQGYVIRAPNDFTTTLQPWSGIFTGKPNNGVVSIPVTILGAGKNLVGNPYPSNIDLDQLTANNPSTAQGTYYFWTNADDFIDNGTGSSGGTYGNYTSNHYATYNGVGAASAANSLIIPSRYVRPGQGFLYQASEPGTLVFDNSVRTKESTGSIFISNKKGEGKEAPRSEKYRLKLTTPIGNFNTLLIAYFEGASNNFEPIYDSKFPVSSSDRFYSISDNTNLIIQGRQYPFVDNDVVSLGMSNFVQGTYNIALSETEGIFNNGQDIYLKDKQTGTVTNLSQASYSFTANEGVSDTRFEIIYKPETVLVTDNTIKDELQVYRDGTEFVIKSQSKKITDLEVYDTSGRLVLKSAPNRSETRVEGKYMINGMYILKINRNGEITSKKIIK